MKRLIFYCDVKYAIRTFRGKKPKVTEYIVNQMICKDPDSREFKKRILREHFKDKSVNTRAKFINEFDLKNLYVRYLCIRKKLGYENNSAKKR